MKRTLPKRSGDFSRTESSKERRVSMDRASPSVSKRRAERRSAHRSSSVALVPSALVLLVSACLDASKYEVKDQGGGGGPSIDRAIPTSDQGPAPIDRTIQADLSSLDEGISEQGLVGDEGLFDGGGDGGGSDALLADGALSDRAPLPLDQAPMPELNCPFRFLVTLPPETPADDLIYLTGDFWSAIDPSLMDWSETPAQGLLVRDGAQASIDLSLPAFREIQYKLNRGSWDAGEVNAACQGGPDLNRRLSVFCTEGEEEPTEIAIEVENWSDLCRE